MRSSGTSGAGGLMTKEFVVQVMYEFQVAAANAQQANDIVREGLAVVPSLAVTMILARSAIAPAADTLEELARESRRRGAM